MKRRKYPKKSLWVICFLFALISTQSEAQMADGKCKFLGSIIAGAVPSDFGQYWNQVTPENGGKWGSVEATRDVMDWSALDIAYNHAKDNGLPFKQHTFVWGQQQPAWIDALSVAEQEAEVDEWIKAFCERYPETDFIDVVNEPLHAVPGYAAALGGSGLSGWEWVVWTFEKARQHCPNAKLALNDYNIINNDAATATYLNIVNLLKDKGLIDIVGEQGHFLETTPSATIKKNLDRLHAAGLPIHISEYDVNLADDQAQNQKYQEQFPMLWEHPGVQGITLWGYKQNQIWREDAYLIRSDGTVRPALTWLAGYVEGNQGGTFCNPVTGMLDETGGAIEIYPSPARNGEFTLKLGAGNFDIRILNLQGIVKKEMHVSGDAPVAVRLNEAAGVYLLKVYDGRQTTWKKILVN